MNIFFSLLAGLLAGTAGAMGLGGGSVLLIYLTLFAGVGQLAAQGINLLFFLPTALLSVIIYSFRKEIEWKKIIPIMIFGVVGTLISAYLVNFIKTDIIKKIFGGLILIYGLVEVFTPKKKENKNT